MKILVLKASQDSDFKEYKRYMSSPPQSLFSFTAALPAGVQYELVDETVGDKVPKSFSPDLVFIFASTPDIMRAYELSAQYRDQGKTVVMAGLHVSFLPDEAALNADSIIVGESDLLIPQILSDFQSGQLQIRYSTCEQVDMSKLSPWPATEKLQKRYGEWGVLVGRGCRYNCSYCTVRPFFNREAFRPVSHIIDEIRTSGAKSFELHADNICADRDYAMELFTALEPLKIQWTGEATIDFVEDEELLAAAARSGLYYLVVGLETASQLALNKAGKGFIKTEKAKEYIAALHKHNIIVDSCLLFGFDEHDSTIFDQTIEFIDHIKLDVAHPNIVTPFPGTRFFKKLDTEGRLLTKDWGHYDCSQVVFLPKQMSVGELEAGVDRVNSTLSSMSRKVRRMGRIAAMQGATAALYVA